MGLIEKLKRGFLLYKMDHRLWKLKRIQAKIDRIENGNIKLLEVLLYIIKNPIKFIKSYRALEEE